MRRSDICILVTTGDKNSWVWEPWYENFSKWNIDLSVVFLSENIPFEKPGITSVMAGDVPYSDGIIDYILGCNHKWVVPIHEDYFFTGYDECKLFKLIELMESHNLQLVKACGAWAGFQDEKNPHTITNIETGFDGDENERYLWLYNNNTQYLTSHQISIWRTEFYLSTLYRGEDPWATETIGSDRLRLRNVAIHAYRGAPPIPYEETVGRGRIRPGCHHYFIQDIVNQYS